MINMKLERILELFNKVYKTKWVVVRSKSSIDTFAKGLKDYKIKLMSPDGKTIHTVSKASIKDISEELEEKIVDYLFRFTYNAIQ